MACPANALGSCPLKGPSSRTAPLSLPPTVISSSPGSTATTMLTWRMFPYVRPGSGQAVPEPPHSHSTASPAWGTAVGGRRVPPLACAQVPISTASPVVPMGTPACPQTQDVKYPHHVLADGP